MTIEAKYNKKTLHQHILDRPDSYIGSVSKITETVDIYDEKTQKIIEKNITYSPGLIKIFDEVLVNAIDHSVRDKSMNYLMVNVDDKSISVLNNGEGIPIVKHKEYGIYVPELIFGNLLTSSNYDDNEKRTIGGRNGLGSKATNIYSLKFIVETVRDGVYYKQTFSENMTKKTEPIIKNVKNEDFTKIHFYPDLKRFGGLTTITEDIQAIIHKKTLDVIVNINRKIKIVFNKKAVKVKSVADYFNLYLQPEAKKVLEEWNYKYEGVDFHWVVGCAYSKIGYRAKSFVNGVNTVNGGKHVDAMVKNITTIITDKLKTKTNNISPNVIKERLFVLVKATVVNPSFSSQSKDVLTTPVKSFGSPIPVFSKGFIKNLLNLEILNDIKDYIEFKEKKDVEKAMNKPVKNIKHIKLIDADYAGTKKSNLCSLILTEGDSAKSFVVSGLSQADRKYYGVFPLKGKCISATTNVLLWDGNIKLANQLIVGDEIIGDDGTKRTILNLSKGVGYMYKVCQTNGNPYEVNEDHILTVCFPSHKKIKRIGNNWKTVYWCKDERKIKYTTFNSYYASQDFLNNIDDNNVIDIPIKEFISLENNHKFKGVRGKCINWKENKLSIDPFALGNLVGNGSLNRIPVNYIVNTFDIRIDVLFGITYIAGKFIHDNEIELVCNNHVFKDLEYLVNSLGFCIKSVDYGSYKVVSILLTRKTKGSLDIQLTNKKEYIGLEVDGNGRFLINDFTATHNCINVRDATNKQITGNEELKNIINILGLKIGTKYDENMTGLRYGSLVVLTDSDYDGYHIKGLIINIFHYFWPELLKMNFLKYIKTPIIKARKNNDVKSFYNEFEFKNFINNTTGTWKTKYYKGLGTSTKEEAIDIFSNKEKNTVQYIHDKNTTNNIELAFNKKYADARKVWINEYDKNSVILGKENKVSLTDFINKELIHFSVYDNIRSIPSICDGLKPSQRKVLYTCLNRPGNNDIKVAQLGAMVAEKTAYHHGEQSLFNTIINMAQEFVGSNNIPLLVPEGQFGTRLQNGADAAAPRYIFSRLAKSALDIFDKDDFDIIPYEYDDERQIEPTYYVPLIPMVLVNGAIGIGTGFSTTVYPYNPKEIIRNMMLILNKKTPYNLLPWFKGYKGRVDDQYIYGVYEKKTNSIVIREIPIGWSIDKYYSFLVETIHPMDEIYDVKNNCSDDVIQFDIIYKSNINNMGDDDIVKLFKLNRPYTTTNMYLFDVKGKLKKYTDPNDIIKDFVKIRLDYNLKRKLNILTKIKKDLLIYKNKMRFIQAIINNELIVFKKTKNVIINLLVKDKYDMIDSSYDYLLRMSIYNFTKEDIDLLEKKTNTLSEELKIVSKKTEKNMMIEDLEKIFTTL
jgi:DNA gyrase/topoisomerase IV subunit B